MKNVNFNTNTKILPKTRTSILGNLKSKNNIDMSVLEKTENNQERRTKVTKTSKDIVKIPVATNFFDLIAKKVIKLTSKDENFDISDKSIIFSKSSIKYFKK